MFMIGITIIIMIIGMIIIMIIVMIIIFKGIMSPVSVCNCLPQGLVALEQAEERKIDFQVSISDSDFFCLKMFSVLKEPLPSRSCSASSPCCSVLPPQLQLNPDAPYFW